MHKLLFVFGTRPEAVKLSPVWLHMRRRSQNFEVRVCVTAQLRSMLDQVLAAFYDNVPGAHAEAGLRTGDPWQPFPEEMNRVLTTRMTELHFAATEGAARNLESEGIGRGRIFVTGNSGIDAMLHVKPGLESGTLRGAEWPQLDSSKKLIVVTAHRRESAGDGFENICTALAELAERGDVQIVYPVHRNPDVQDPVNRKLGNRAKPILVLRDKTERPEALEAATARLVGTDAAKIKREARLLLDDTYEYAQRARVHNQYGDGHAGIRIEDAIHSFCEGRQR